MDSDISNLLKKEKTSLIDLLSKKGSTENTNTETYTVKKSWKNLLLPITVTIVLILAVSTAGYFSYKYFFKGVKVQIIPPGEKTAGHISYESEYDLILKNKSEYSEKLNEAAADGTRFGSIKKINVKISNEGINKATFKDLLKIWEAVPPVDLEFIALPDVQQFIYYSDTRPALITAVKISDAPRALASMLSWEPRMPAELGEFLLTAKPDFSIVFFEDKIHEGVSYRFGKMSFSEDFGLGYFVQSQKNLLVIASSEESIRISISRLLKP